MVWVAEDAQESSGRNHWEWFQETLARLPEIGTLFTHCRRDTSLSFTQTFSQIVYSKSTILKYLPALSSIFFLARLYEILYTP